MSTTFTQAKKDFADSLRQMVDEADELLSSAAANGDEKIEAVRDRFSEQVSDMRDLLDELEHTARHRARRFKRAADDTLQSHPYGAVGIAAAVGLLIGLLVARR